MHHVSRNSQKSTRISNPRGKRSRRDYVSREKCVTSRTESHQVWKWRQSTSESLTRETGPPSPAVTPPPPGLDLWRPLSHTEDFLPFSLPASRGDRRNNLVMPKELPVETLGKGWKAPWVFASYGIATRNWVGQMVDVRRHLFCAQNKGGLKLAMQTTKQRGWCQVEALVELPEVVVTFLWGALDLWLQTSTFLRKGFW